METCSKCGMSHECRELEEINGMSNRLGGKARLSLDISGTYNLCIFVLGNDVPNTKADDVLFINLQLSEAKRLRDAVDRWIKKME